jgi:hypothetical protein
LCHFFAHGPRKITVIDKRGGGGCDCESVNKTKMEELRKLEKVQRMVQFMDSRGVSVSNSDHHCNRFLANFMLFLLEPCGDLAIDDKCCLISELIPRVSNFFTPSLYLLSVLIIAFEN